MTDGQSFLLLFFVFYFLECFVLVTPGTQVFARGFGRHYQLRGNSMDLGGIRKRAYYLYFLPWPGRAHAFPPPGDQAAPLPATPPNYGRYLRFLNRAADPLALNGFLLWLIFFVFIPVTYWLNPNDNRVLIFAGAGYLLLFWQTIVFFRLHRRFYPERNEERLKHTLTMCFLPWHGMKAADNLALRPRLRLHPIHREALLLPRDIFLERARRFWRETRFRPGTPDGHAETVMAFLLAQGLTPADLESSPPDLQDDERYCPVCFTVYASTADRCRECGGTALQR